MTTVTGVARSPATGRLTAMCWCGWVCDTYSVFVALRKHQDETGHDRNEGIED